MIGCHQRIWCLLNEKPESFLHCKNFKTNRTILAFIYQFYWPFGKEKPHHKRIYLHIITMERRRKKSAEFTRNTHDLRNCSGKFSNNNNWCRYSSYHLFFFGWLINLCHLQFHTWMSNLTAIIWNSHSNCSLHYYNRTVFVVRVSRIQRYKCPISNTWIFIFFGSGKLRK